MHAIEIVLLLLSLMVAMALIAHKLKIAFPILLTIGGLVIGLFPQLPVVSLEPSIVLLVFLPPILYSAAWYTNFKEFVKNIEPITVLALGLVVTTCIGVAYTALWFLPGFTLATGFLLGAIVSPPDAVAATAVLKTVQVPKKVVTILEGESLVNDATALVAFQIAIITISTGEFSIHQSIWLFFKLAIGGIAIGLLIGVLAFWLHKYFTLDAGVEIVLTFVTAYAAYIIAEHLHCSGVLSVVAAGLFIGSKQATLHKANMRIKAVAVWEFVNVVLNGLIFILIGLQLPVVVKQIPAYTLWQLCGYGIVVSVAVVAIRFAFIFLVDELSNRIRKKLHKPTVFTSKKHITVLAYTAMRGIVSLAAVFSIPVALQDGTAFPQKDIIVFITFIVILFTLVLQGLCLPMLIKKLKFTNDASAHSKNDIKKNLAMAAVNQLQTYITNNNINDAMATNILHWHKSEAHLHSNNNNFSSSNKQLRTTLLLQTIIAKRTALLQMLHAHIVDAEMYHELQHEIDLEEARIA